jgi:hypothetical protein
MSVTTIIITEEEVQRPIIYTKTPILLKTMKKKKNKKRKKRKKRRKRRK